MSVSQKSANILFGCEIEWEGVEMGRVSEALLEGREETQVTLVQI